MNLSSLSFFYFSTHSKLKCKYNFFFFEVRKKNLLITISFFLLNYKKQKIINFYVKSIFIRKLLRNITSFYCIG